MRIDLPSPAELTQGRAATPTAFIRAIVLAYRRRGMDATNALQQARIAPEVLADANARVTAAQMETMSAVAMQELDDEALSWFSRRLPWGSHGMLCRASLTAPNLKVALQRWCRHHRLLTEDIVLRLQVDEARATIEIAEQCALGELREFCLVTTLRYLLGYACWLVDSRIVLLASTFPFPAPPHVDAYPYLFPGPLGFDAAAASFSFDARYLALPVRRDERALQAMLQRALPLTVRQYRRDRLLVHSVRQLLQADVAAAHTAEEVAAQLNLSVRTLHRQLKDEGVALQALKNEARRKRAGHLLLQTKKPLKQIAAEVGFDNEKSFARAFRDWTGLAPGAWRAGAGPLAALDGEATVSPQPPPG